MRAIPGRLSLIQTPKMSNPIAGRKLAQKAINSVPQSNDAGVNTSAKLNYSSVNGSNNLLPEELIESTGTTQANMPTNNVINNVSGVSNTMLNNTTRAFDNNVNTNNSLVNPVVNKLKQPASVMLFPLDSNSFPKRKNGEDRRHRAR